ncbi:membrane lipoprotein lipid attachment site-containing protein [Psychrilyobacter atlanticus]|uniref:membrane lipoprotein lipid attachment site-containing protein n=1 Tax=Psychrilyobacter atlanticus TaxID=271091 RepID=UPI0004267BDD|nr:membrane lipoprotein lipid attachment site-containing protein [Psychrilyobacter atlanticus]
MKKILFGLLIVGALSACSSSEEKVDIPTQVQTLNETVSTQIQEYESLKAETEELKMQVQELNNSINESKN